MLLCLSLEVLHPLSSSHPTCVFRIGGVEWSDCRSMCECDVSVLLSVDG